MTARTEWPAERIIDWLNSDQSHEWRVKNFRRCRYVDQWAWLKDDISAGPGMHWRPDMYQPVKGSPVDEQVTNDMIARSCP